MLMKKLLLFVLAAGIFAATGYSQVVHYPLDTDTRDAVGGKHGTPSLNGVSFVTDDVRGAVMELDGEQGIVTLPSNLFTGMANATVSCWFNFYGGAAWQRVWSFGHIDGPWAMFYFCPRDGWDGNNMHVTILGEGREWRDWNPVVIDTLKWHFVAAVFDADTFKFFLNNEMVIRHDSVPATPDEIMCDPNEGYLGRSHWPDATFNGMIDDFRIYDRALSDAEVHELYMSTGGTSVPVPKALRDVAMWGYAGKIWYNGVDDSAVREVRVHSITGQLVHLTNRITELRSTRFNPGLYIVNITDNEGVISKKVMIPE
ncbi:MAG TPA: T9SS type A sorting domain-containing protein [Bacteroides sp.]|nr:T9SS type A sorting domain-containing protein [Bacteroides sp.]